MAFFDKSSMAQFCASYIQLTQETSRDIPINVEFVDGETVVWGKNRAPAPSVTIPTVGDITADITKISIDIPIDIPTEQNLAGTISENVNDKVESTKEKINDHLTSIKSSIGGDIVGSFSGIGNSFKNAFSNNQAQTLTTDGTAYSATGTALMNIASNLGYGELSFSSYGFNLSDYKKILLNNPDKDFAALRNLLEDYTISAGAAFLHGNLTSAFAEGVKNVPMVQNTLRTVVNGKQIYDKAEYLIDNGADMLKTTIETCVSKIVTTLTKDVTKNIFNMGKTVIDYGKDVPNRISKRALSYFNTYKPDLSDIIKQFIENKEDEEKKKRENKQQSDVAKFLANLDNTVTNVTYKINNITGTLNKTFEAVFTYSNAGFGWVNDRIDNLLEETSTMIYDISSEWQQGVKKEMDETVNTLGEKYGKVMIKEYEKLLVKAQKKIENKKSETLTIALLTASTVLQKAKLKIMSLTGVNIPL